MTEVLLLDFTSRSRVPSPRRVSRYCKSLSRVRTDRPTRSVPAYRSLVLNQPRRELSTMATRWAGPANACTALPMPGTASGWVRRGMMPVPRVR